MSKCRLLDGDMPSSPHGRKSRSSSPESIVNEEENRSLLPVTEKAMETHTDTSSTKKRRGKRTIISEEDSVEFQMWKELQQGGSTVSTVSCNTYLSHHDDWKSVTKLKNPIPLGKWFSELFNFINEI